MGKDTGGSWGYRNQPPFLRDFLEGKKTAWEKLMAHPSLLCSPAVWRTVPIQGDGWLTPSVSLEDFLWLHTRVTVSLLPGRPEVPRS